MLRTWWWVVLPWILLAVHGTGALAMLGAQRGLDAMGAAWLALLAPLLFTAACTRTMVARAWASFDDSFARGGALLIGLLLAIALFAPLVSTHVPAALGDPVDDRYLAPSAQHWLGTDLLGRDLYSRVIHGARVSLGIGVASVMVSMGLGVLVGALAGWRRGWVDGVLMRFTDLVLAFPRLFLVLMLVAFVDPGPSWIVLVLGLTGWMGVARVVRGQVLQLREADYVVAARALGVPDLRVVLRHVLPATLGSVVALSTLRVGNAILAESFLSFLGLGVQDPWVSWGLLIREGRDMLLGAWWLAIYPGLAIVITVLGFNLLGDGLRDVLDPRPVPGTGALDD